MQLAMALSVSASVSDGGGAGDPDGEQIRKAKLMSLGRGNPGAAGDQGGEETAESLSRRYQVTLLNSVISLCFFPRKMLFPYV